MRAEPAAVLARLPLRGGGGEPVDLRRTLLSHGVAALPPNRVDEARSILETTVLTGGGRARSIRLSAAGSDGVRLEALGGGVAADEARDLAAIARHLLGLDVDLSSFYAAAATDPGLAWVTSGAGRMIRSPTVFEDVVKTVCTTNCSWSATERMVGALVTHLGEASAAGQRAFPTPSALAGAPEAVLRDVARCGYRAAYVRALAATAADDGGLGLEALRDPALPDDEVERRLLALPGVGPYAAAHIMLTALGRHGRLILDSWTRPTYARLHGRRISDEGLRRRFRKYGRFAGLAFWLTLTQDWVAG